MSLSPSNTKTNSDGALVEKSTASSLRFPEDFEVEYGPFQACNIKLNEAVVEKQVLRVHLDNENFSKKPLLKTVTPFRTSSRPKQLSCKLRETLSPVKKIVDQSKTPRPRGRPPKVIKADTLTEKEDLKNQIIKSGRGRPPKIISTITKAETPAEKENLKNQIEKPRGRGRPSKIISKLTKAETPVEKENLKNQVDTPRGRGRPSKIISTLSKAETPAEKENLKNQTETPRGRGRPSKIISTAETPAEKENSKNQIQESRGRPRKKHRQVMDNIKETPKSNGEDLQAKVNHVEGKKSNVYNGPSKKKGEYRLKMLPEPKFEDRRLNYKFSKLAVDVRSLRLPAAHWKIKIYMRNKAISAIAFTNKKDPERVLKFSSASDLYEVTIDGRKAHLLGSPVTVDGRADVEALLDIVHSVETDNPMIDYH